jgi:hypothetical protein
LSSSGDTAIIIPLSLTKFSEKGRVEECGRVEEWKIGRMELWKNGKELELGGDWSDLVPPRG